ncbi:MAG: BamA/TamA family outer membrane protein [Methylocystis sp.]
MIVRASAGASILWNSPMGPLRFDYAIPYLKSKVDVTQYFRFSGGTNF